jgi:anti-anti-sigma factor
MTIYQAEQIKPALLAALEQSSVLEINLAGVTEIDTAGVQLLMLAKETARAAQKELRLTAHSEAVAEVFELIDLVPYFGDPLVIAPQASHAAERAAHSPA